MRPPKKTLFALLFCHYIASDTVRATENCSQPNLSIVFDDVTARPAAWQHDGDVTGLMTWFGDALINHTSNGPSAAAPPGHDYVTYVSTPLMLAVGLVGNALTVRVMLTREFRALPISVYLIALAVANSVVLAMTPFNKPFMRRLLATDPRAASAFSCLLFFALFPSAKVMSSWLVVLICHDRFVATWFPTRRSVHGTRAALVNTAALLLCVATFNVVRSGYNSGVRRGVCQPNGGAHPVAVLWRVAVVTYGPLPAVILALFTSLILQRLRRLRRVVHPAEPGAGPRRITVMLLAVIVTFVLLVVPYSVMQLVAMVWRLPVYEARQPAFVALRRAATLLDQLLSAVNFFLYVVTSKMFREKLVQLVLRRNSSATTTTTGGHVTTSVGRVTSSVGTRDHLSRPRDVLSRPMSSNQPASGT